MSAGPSSDNTPKALLALDGGGLRGAFSLGVLGEMESLLRKKTGAEDTFVLSDFFDFIGGTSTGAIIATGLALGWPVDKLKDKYRTLGAAVFHRRRFVPAWAWSKYPGEPLRRQLQAEFGDRTFGDPDIRTLLMIVLHNRSTDSPWPLVNERRAHYNDGRAPTHHNLDLRLWQLLSASTAAPSFFPPVYLDLGTGPKEFVDGGVTAHNNPALQMFLSATIPEYQTRWPTGPENMLLISVGTGSSPQVLTNLNKLKRHLLYVATKTPAGLMFAAANHNDVICRALGETRFGSKIDSELGTMVEGGLSDLFGYARYNVELTARTLDEFGLPPVDPNVLARMDVVDNIETLMTLGQRYAQTNLAEWHFSFGRRLKVDSGGASS
ncbi:MAG: patatin-like phospholipase family protein [Actinomycetota bacterium]|nr:patatin-like phospholipase family protein [Actinomycetota bacterium]